MKIPKLLLPILLCAIIYGFIPPVQTPSWEQLFDRKDLNGWDTYLGPDLDENGKPITGKPIGLNNDPSKVFSIVRDHGENVIRISGENWGAISTHKEYENYHLQLQFKWGALLWGQKKR